ncbi:hypothetical protein BU16DRAFT_524555 [Lophium mytilinum]|uniref:Extracellular membrane protein CFEM domain-containing protein n=1 Tax=Lophium mytilinum TaxID=390894 RepID=A0A6A6R3E4_9PEZI|nr:hypothetical protein BU16DRAFT_524555 [Lophium mytilinum]
MKYSAIILSTLIACAFARPNASATVTAAPSVVSGLSPAQTCIALCKAGDVDCEAACVGAAHPNSSQVVDTTQCAMKCDQGDGTPAATQKYSACVQACIASHFPTSQTIADAAGTAVASASVTGSQASEATGKSTTGTKATGSATGTVTGAAASSSTGAANAHAQMGAGAASFAGLLMAIFAL